MHSYLLAALVTGKFPSYFADKPIPVQEAKKEEQEPEAADNEDQSAETAQNATLQAKSSLQSKGDKRPISLPGKILLIGSSSMISDTILDAAGEGPNSVLVMNLIDALNGREDMAALRSKVQELNPLRATSGQTKTLVKAVNIIGLPCAVILFGLLVWAGRARRKRRIQKMFFA
jgi:ABC-type uncharacterized transport system involved in gliding motility auxiliary subunit